MARDVLPPEVIRILSLHGPVTWWVGGDSARARGHAPVAPFEDAVYLLVPIGSPLEQALLQDCRMRVSANAEDGRYRLRMEGRGQAGMAVARHARRPEITPWTAEDANLTRLLAVPFVPEEIEYVRSDGEVDQRFVGPTPAERLTPSAVWARGLLLGLALPFHLLLISGVFGWLALQGPEYPGRPIALAVAVAAGALPLGGVRILAMAHAFDRWRQGLVLPSEAPLFIEGHLAPGEARTVGLGLIGIGLVLLALVAGVWGGTLAGLAFGLSGVWVVAPAMLLHGSVSEPKR